MSVRAPEEPSHRRIAASGFTRRRAVVSSGGILAVCVLLIALVLSCQGPSRPTSHESHPRPANQATGAQVRAEQDAFGIKYLRRTLPRGTYWVSAWDSERKFSGVDPQDDWFDAAHGAGTFEAGGGELAITGSTPRMYVHDPDSKRQWSDVEITVYAKRVDDEGIPFAGITAVARSNHLQTEEGPSDLCDTRGYGGRLRFDGHADFEKETAHPRNEAISNTQIFPGELPTDVWIGVKYIVFDAPDGVHLELWLDRTDGRNGGDWKLIDEVVDDGHLFGNAPCAAGIDPQMALTKSPRREGSESGRPNLSVYFRSDGIAPNGLIYKWASIREISP